jgi:hypothetical protein
MTEDYDIGTKSVQDFPIAGLELVEFAEYMTNQNATAGQFLNAFIGKVDRSVVVPADCKHLRDTFQTLYDFELADIASMNNRVHAFEDRCYRLVEEPMSV